MLSKLTLDSSNRIYKGYTLLLQLLPRLKEMLEDPAVDTDTFNHFIAQVRYFYVSLLLLKSPQLQKGANDARSDDVRHAKEEIANWINQTLSPTAPLSLKQRDDRGLQNDITGRLLCPIELRWDDIEYTIPSAHGQLLTYFLQRSSQDSNCGT
jgi:hypothetical protein